MRILLAHQPAPRLHDEEDPATRRHKTQPPSRGMLAVCSHWAVAEARHILKVK